MKLILLSLLLLAAPAWAGWEPEAIDQERLATAIYHAEGGKRAKVPYGILSVKVRGEAEARQVCLNTINNNLARWQYARANGDRRNYLQFLADRYCPVGADNDPSGLNHHWRSNVARLYERGLKNG